MSNWIKSYTHLKDRPHGDKALELLQRIASLVMPIMRARGWVLPVLSEFFPSNPGLLGMNVNHGQKIYIRLRHAHRPDTFFDEEELIGTMLHELTHNVHGPHDDKFYKYLSGLEDEYYKLRANGYAGEGFHSTGKRLGQGVSHNVPMQQAKSQAVLAAEKRAIAAGIMGSSGGRKLGGVSKLGTTMKTPREMAAEAAERRARDEKTCGSISDDAIQRESAKAAEESILDIPDIDVPPSPPTASTSMLLPPPNKRSLPSPERSATAPDYGSKRQRKDEGVDWTSLSPAAAAAWRRQAGISQTSSDYEVATSSGSAPRPPRRAATDIGGKGWDCKVCTLVNRPLALTCEACGAYKPIDPLMGWTCLECGEGGNAVEWWTCKKCGRMKSEAAGG